MGLGGLGGKGHGAKKGHGGHGKKGGAGGELTLDIKDAHSNHHDYEGHHGHGPRVSGYTDGEGKYHRSTSHQHWKAGIGAVKTSNLLGGPNGHGHGHGHGPSGKAASRPTSAAVMGPAGWDPNAANLDSHEQLVEMQRKVVQAKLLGDHDAAQQHMDQLKNAVLRQGSKVLMRSASFLDAVAAKSEKEKALMKRNLMSSDLRYQHLETRISKLRKEAEWANIDMFTSELKTDGA